MKKLIAVIVALITIICGCAAACAEQKQKPVTREESIRIALDDAGLKEGQVTFTKVRMDQEDGRQVWEIEFVSNGIEYEYDVDLRTGRILESDTEYCNNCGGDDDQEDWFDFD